MKNRLHLLLIGLIAGLLPRVALAEGSMFGKFYVSAVAGQVECTSDGRIWDLKKGDIVLARGSHLKTDAKANITLVFSNQTSMFLDEKTELKVEKFDQEPFSPNNNLLIEPSNSTTVISLDAGQLIVNTPQLLSGTTMAFVTKHASITLLNQQAAGEQAFIEVNEKQTHAVVVRGQASVKVRDKDGKFASLGTPLLANHQAFVKQTLNGSHEDIAVSDGGGAPGMANSGSVGEFTVAKADGKVTWTNRDGTLDLAPGEHHGAGGATIRTADGAKATLLFANGASYALAPNTEVKIDKFTQEAFAPNNDLSIEPSNSETHLTLRSGSVDIDTPQLLSGSHLVFETIHSAITILNDQSGGEKAMIAVTDKNTHFVMTTGRATVQPREADGTWSNSYNLKTGQQAFVKFTVGADQRKAAAAANAAPGPSVAQMAAAASVVDITPLPTVAEGVPTVSRPAEAKVLKISGTAGFRLPTQAEGTIAPLTLGAQLPQGSVITTTADSEVYLQPFDGAVSVLRPNSEVYLERLELATADGVIMKQIARLDLRKGTIVSNIDPAKRNINDYSVRTPKGIAAAHGTAFTVTVTNENPSVASTADTVTFTTPSGSTYSINAGNVTMTEAGGTPQPPVPLSQAVAANPAFASVVQAAVTTISTVVQNNIGNLPPNSAANLISQIVSIASTALPAQAAGFASQAVTAVTASTASTSSNAAGAAAAITSAAVTASPGQASAVAVATAQAAPSMANNMAASAAQAAPSQAGNIATGVINMLSQASPTATSAQATQTASSVASAITAAAPAQAASVASAAMQSLNLSNPQASIQSMTQAATSVASAVTAAAPAQAASVASAVMQSVTSNAPQASTASLGQTATALASAITSNAPTQAAPVATALMQVMSQSSPQGTAETATLSSAVTAAANQGSASSTTASNSGGSTGSATGGSAGSTAGGSTSSTTGGTTGSSTASTGGTSTGSSTGSTTSGSTGSTAGGSSSSNTASTGSTAGGATSQSTSVIISQIVGDTSASPTSTTPAANNGGNTPQPTSIIVTQLNGSQLSQISANLQNTQNATNTATFSSSSAGGQTNTVTVTPTVPVNNSTNNVVSPNAI